MQRDHEKTYGADLFRGLAILMVVVYHAFPFVYSDLLRWKGWFRDFESLSTPSLLWFYPITFGWAGVAFFFVLSGFCIHLSFLRSKDFGIGHFLWRRLWRIYPAYLVSLVVFAFLDQIYVFERYGAVQFLSHALFLHNLSGYTFFTINPPFWSIAVEMQLYLLFPLLLLLRSRFGILGCLVATFSLGLIWRAATVWRWGLPDHIITPAFSSPLMTWYDWALGAFVAERFFQGKPAFSSKGIWMFSLSLLFGLSTLVKPLTPFSFSLAAGMGAVILDAMLHVRWKPNFWVGTFAFMGMISYSMYLWHQPVLFRFTHHRHPTLGEWIVAFFLLTAGSWVSYRILERRGMHIGDLLWKRWGRSRGPQRRATDLGGTEGNDRNTPGVA